MGSNGTESVLYTFQDSGDGAYPFSGVIEDASGNLYGTTRGDQVNSLGSIYKLDQTGTLTTLYAFCSRPRCVDGSLPAGGLVMDKKGNLYGTTSGGGANGYGTIFKYESNGTLKVLYSFRDGNDGGYPLADLISDPKGNLYGSASQGGVGGAGTVFEFAIKKRRFEILHSFSGGQTDGSYPEFGLTIDSSGNLYGTTIMGGNESCADDVGCGTIFKISPNRTETILYTFQGGSDGSAPSGLVLDSNGNLYGASSPGTNGTDQGAIFKLTPGGTFTVLQSVNCQQDGCLPFDSVIEDNSGNLYGTMAEGGTANCDGFYCGTVFRLTP
ncbi:MAG: choice-of-anchor tandem repeat GloVer-containing protein [Rhizomicrobium sp.]